MLSLTDSVTIYYRRLTISAVSCTVIATEKSFNISPVRLRRKQSPLRVNVASRLRTGGFFSEMVREGTF
jgi:hypothetical protein